MKQTKMISTRSSFLIRLMLVLLLALSLFAFAACQKDKQDSNVETPDDPSAHEHVFGEWVTTENPSCTVAGVKERICTVEGCGKKETASVDPLGHDTVHHAAQAATCIAVGWNAYDTCSRCDYTTYEEIAALGHDLVHHAAQVATCIAVGWNAYDTCSRCEYTTYEEIAKLGHEYEDHYCVRCDQLDPTYYTDGLIFELSMEDTYSVIGYNGAATDVVIPVTYRNNPVTLIRCGAFEQKGLTTILIPEGVTRVESKAFSYCPSLTSLNIPKSLTIIEESAFQRCNGLTSINVAGNNPKFHSAGNCLIETERKTLVLGCRNSVIPADDSVEKIGSYAFSGCSNLTSITIPGNVTIIGRGAFQDSGLISIIFSDGVVEFKEGAFAGCSNLTSIVFPKSVGMIENGAFYNCNRLTMVYYCGLISDNFGGNSSGNVFPYATRYYYSETEPTSDDDWWHYVDGAPTVWPREHAWGDWTTTTQPTCTEPGEKTRACTSCNATEWDEVPALGHKITHKSAAGPTCTKDGNVECWYCSACEKYFEDENGETKTTWDAVKINALGHDLVHHAAQAVSCTAIGWDAYDTCSRCDYTTYEEIAALGHDLVHHDAQAVTCTEYGWDAYDTCSRCDYTTYEKIAALGHNYNENNVCTRCNQLDPTYYTEGLSFTLLQDDTYSVKEYNGDATDVTIPSVYQNKAVTEIGVQAFFYLSNLTSVVIPDSVTSIQENAFTGCSGLTSITIPDSVTAIGGAAFNACSGLTSIYIPAGVTQIGIVAFTGCSGLTSISVAENNPEFHSAGNCLIHTASETLIAGCNNSVIPDDGSVTMIADDAFASCSGLTSFSIPEGVSFISFAVFCGCSNLSSIVIPDSVETIAGNAFEGCNNLTAVYYGGSASDWDGISIADYNNGCLTGATRYYYSETEPTVDGNWWHYVNGVPTAWHRHSWGDWTTTTQPSCISAGEKTRTCTTCDETETAEVPALGHDLVHHDAQAVTCTAIGWDAYDTCSRCDYTTYEEIAALGHDLVHHDAQAVTCTAIGWDAYDTCTRCDYTTYEEIAALEHDYVYHAAQEPTCTAVGWYEYYACSRCDYTTYQEIAALGHDIVNHGAQAATCTAVGWNAYDTCSRCDYTTYEEIPALGHDLVHHDAQAVTCTAIGWDAYDTCSRCDYTTYEEIAALDHDYVYHDAQEPACTAVGWYEYYTCSRCDYTTYEEIPPLGHDLVHHDAQEPACTVGWYEYYTCSRCDYTTYREIAALDHDYVYHDAQEPTCTDVGWYEYYTCTRCDYTTYQEIAALGHNYDENNVCTRCGQRDPTYYTEGLVFELSGEDTYKVIGYNGSATEVYLPAIYQNKAVTEIGWCAFENSNFISIYIPESVTTTSTCVFEGCNNLTSISVAENNPKFHSAGNCLIETASKTLMAGCKSSVIPDDGSVTAIKDGAFKNCGSLISISIPKDVETIGVAAFMGCSGLTSISIFDGVIEIDNDAFERSGLISISIPKSVTTIGRWAFDECSNLTNVYYGGSASDWDAISIDYNNDYLTGATRYYYSETEPTTDADWWRYVEGVPTAWPRNHTWGNWDITTQPTCTETGVKTRTCTVCNMTESEVIPALGHNMTHMAAAEPTCTIAGNVEHWYCDVCGKYFEDENGDTETTWDAVIIYERGHDLTYHAAQAVSCTAVGWNAYETCSRCDYTTYEEIPALGHALVHHDAQEPTCTNVGWYAYDTCSRCDYTTYEEIPALGHNFENNFCARCGMEYYTEGLQFSLMNDDTYKVAGYNGGATEVYIPATYQKKSVTVIDRIVFFKRSDITSIRIPEGISEIGTQAFYDCSGLTSIVIPESVTLIQDNAFTCCSGLTSITVAENNSVYHSAGDCLIETSSKTLILGCRNSIIPTDGSVTIIGDNAFDSCSDLTSISIPECVTAIGYRAFTSCTGLTSIYIPENVDTIAGWAFAYSGLTSIIISKGVTTIVKDAFYRCSGLTYVYYEGSASDWDGTSIGEPNENLTGATRYYYSETEPVSAGNWWHYVNGKPTVW